MADSRVRWLKGELPVLVAEGLLAQDAADRIGRRYDARGTGRGRSLALIAFGVLGAKLIGSGLILLIAHNWEALSPGMRAGLALSLVAAAQALVGFAHFRRRSSAAWREPTAAFLTLALGACLALIAQTYQIQTPVDAFLLRWIALALPVVYLTRSRVAAALYFAGVVWTVAAGGRDGGLILWGLLAAILPYLRSLAREPGGEWGKALVHWSAALAVPLASLFVVPRLLGDAWMVFYPALFAGMFVLDARMSKSDAPLWQRPLGVGGALGVSGVALALTFSGVWRHVDLPVALTRSDAPWLTLPATWAVTALLGLGASAVALRGLPARRWASALVTGLPLLVALAFATALHGGGGGGVQAILANLYVFGLGLAALLHGLARDRLVLANAGMALLSILFFFRFVDQDVALVLRGVAFIVIGVAFLGMNVKLLWARKAVRS